MPKHIDDSTHVFHPNRTFLAGIFCIALSFWIATHYAADAYLKAISEGSELARGLATRRAMEQNIANKKNQEKDLRALLQRSIVPANKKQVDLYLKQYANSQEFRRMAIAGSSDLEQVKLINARNEATLRFHFWFYRMSGIVAALLALCGTICVSRAFIALRFPAKHKSPHRAS